MVARDRTRTKVLSMGTKWNTGVSLWGWPSTGTGCLEMLWRYSSLEVLKNYLDMFLDKRLLVSLLEQRCWTRWPPQVLSNLNHSVTLWSLLSIWVLVVIRIASVWVKQEALNSILNLYWIINKLHQLWRVIFSWTLLFLYIWHNFCTQCFQTSGLVHVFPLWPWWIFCRAISNLLSTSKFFYWYRIHLVVLWWYHYVSCWTLFSCFFVASCLYPSFEAGNIWFLYTD